MGLTMVKFLFDYLFAYGLIVISDILYFNIYSNDALIIQNRRKCIFVIQALLTIFYPFLRDINNSYIIFYYCSLAVPLFFYKDNLKSKISNYLLTFSIYTLTELFISIIFMFIFMLMGNNNIFLSEIVKQNMVIYYIVYSTILIAYRLIAYIFIRLFYKIRIKRIINEIILINLLFIILINNLNFLFLSTKKTFIISNVIYGILAIITIVLLLYILKQIVIKNKENIQNEYKISLYKDQITELKIMEDNYKMVRRNYHDVNNHFIVLSELFRDRNEEELIRYIVEVDRKYNE